MGKARGRDANCGDRGSESAREISPTGRLHQAERAVEGMSWSGVTCAMARPAMLRK